MSETNLGSLYQRHGQFLYAFVRKRVTTDEDAWDLTMDILLRAQEKLRSATEAEERGWLCTSAKNLIIDRYRKAHPAERPARPARSRRS